MTKMFKFTTLALLGLLLGSSFAKDEGQNSIKKHVVPEKQDGAKKTTRGNLKGTRNRSLQTSMCGCSSCTSSILNTIADGHSVGNRINWVKANTGRTESEACELVCGKEFPGICGNQCAPDQCSKNDSMCGCSSCTSSVLNTIADGYSVGNRINWVIANTGRTKNEACELVCGKEFPGICGNRCAPTQCDKGGAPTPPTPNPPTAPPPPTPTPPTAPPPPTPPTPNPPTAPPPPTPTPPTAPPPPTPTPPTAACGCAECTQQVLETMAGDFTCGARITWLQTPKGGSMSEMDACRKIGGEEFKWICGPMCDPDRCGAPAPSPVTPLPTFESNSPSPLYCFPPGNRRTTWNNVWGRYTVEVKEGPGPCGPGDNQFSSNSVSLSGNDLSLRYQKNAQTGNWEAGETRIVLPGGQKFNYGTYKFHVKSVAVINSITQATKSNVLPKELVLGLFTWDDSERYDVHQNYNHEVDVEISRWNTEGNSDVQFLMQPPEQPQMYRFFSGTNNNYDQSDKWFEFTWLPSAITWASNAGGGRKHEYTTDSAVAQGRRDYIQCMPANVEVRFNLWSVFGGKAPVGLADTDYVKVVIDRFEYTEAGVQHIAPGESCSKHCQCRGEKDCINGRCA